MSLPEGGGAGGGLSQPRRLPLEPTRAATSAAARAAAATGSASPPGPLAESHARFDIALAAGRAESEVASAERRESGQSFSALQNDALDCSQTKKARIRGNLPRCSRPPVLQRRGVSIHRGRCVSHP